MLKISRKDIAAVKTDMAVLFVSENKSLYKGSATADLVKRAKTYPEFDGKAGSELLFYDISGVAAGRVLFCGLGKAKDINSESLRAAAGRAVKKGIGMKLSSIALCVPEVDLPDPEELPSAGPVMEGACLANHCFDHYRGKKEQKPFKKIVICGDSGAGVIDDLASRISLICKGTLLAREWVSMPSNDKRPDLFARSIVKASAKEELKAVVMDDRDMKKNGMHAILAVGAGSSRRPKMVVLEYSPKSWNKSVVLVGKGVTFDSGGINLKPSSGISEMKMDMAGAAAVAATVITAARLNYGCRITGVMPIVENMPSGDATRPGDIVKTYSKKTVEIDNTDAEGRLILADALSYAEKEYKPDMIIDMATLTGACVVALGEKLAGVFSPDEDLSAGIVDSSKRTHERCWNMPLPEDYKKLLKSDFADIKNVSSTRWGGAITAALFLSEFVKTKKWCHIDIAGPAYAAKGGDYAGPGGTGFGVRLLLDFLEGV
ncbi:MAG: leucyl aminopeptidase [Deltaproteobacteria bacterium]|nr:leucyl aminopeptidase [Deltaproteobacteria bacterium]